MAYDITRMQPQLFVARDFSHLNDVLADFRNTLAWVRGGDYGIDEALRSRAVNHLVLKKHGGDSIELTGEVRAVHREGRDTGPNLTATVIEVAGPTMISKQFKCVEKPKSIDAVVLIGSERLPRRGHFSLRLASGVQAAGYVVEGHEVVDFHVWVHGEQLAVPTWVYVAIAEAVPSVAGGPADPAQWDEYFGQLESFQAGSSEEVARHHKASELPSALANLYTEVRRMRESKKTDRRRLAQILEESKTFGDEVLLREEVEELLTQN